MLRNVFTFPWFSSCRSSLPFGVGGTLIKRRWWPGRVSLVSPTEHRAGPGMEPNWEVLRNHWSVLLAYGWKEAITEQKKHGWSEPVFVNQIFIKGIFPLHTFFSSPLFWSSPDWQLFVVSFFFFFPWIPSFVKFQTKYSVTNSLQWTFVSQKLVLISKTRRALCSFPTWWQSFQMIYRSHFLFFVICWELLTTL